MPVDSVFKTSGETSAENHWDDLSSSQSSIGEFFLIVLYEFDWLSSRLRWCLLFY
jgi:hypothetical protein